MKKIYYEKVGRRYVPVAEYDPQHILVCELTKQPGK
jgi:hypothetical protein